MTRSSQIELAAAGVRNRDRIQSRHLNREVIDELFRKHAQKLEGQSPAYDGRKTLILTKHLFDEHIFSVSTLKFYMPCESSTHFDALLDEELLWEEFNG